MRQVLSLRYFARSTTKVAQELLGKYLVRRYRGREEAYRITEVEAYDWFRDRASHASKGKTERTKVMFGPPGVWYVYLIYGMHDMINIVTRERGYPAAILIRGADGVDGPGKLTKWLHVTSALNGKRSDKDPGLWIEDRGKRVPEGAIECAPRVGVACAGKYWANKRWRFVPIP